MTMRVQKGSEFTFFLLINRKNAPNKAVPNATMSEYIIVVASPEISFVPTLEACGSLRMIAQPNRVKTSPFSSNLDTYLPVRRENRMMKSPCWLLKM